MLQFELGSAPKNLMSCFALELENINVLNGGPGGGDGASLQTRERGATPKGRHRHMLQ